MEIAQGHQPSLVNGASGIFVKLYSIILVGAPDGKFIAVRFPNIVKRLRPDGAIKIPPNARGPFEMLHCHVEFP
jgi:hypothetical protein